VPYKIIMKKEPISLQLNRLYWNSEIEDLRGIDTQILARMLFDIRVIYNFEEAILGLKNENCVWGPVHTSIGQEAIAAGTVAALKQSDKFFGTHRSHHQFLSKAMQYAVANDWNPALNIVSKEAETVVRKTLAEIMGLSDGYCGGRGGSLGLMPSWAAVFLQQPVQLLPRNSKRRAILLSPFSVTVPSIRVLFMKRAIWQAYGNFLSFFSLRTMNMPLELLLKIHVQ
jgi:hypothetical protein